MAAGTPPQVDDESVRTKVYEWSVPLVVGGERGAIAGTLFWTPQESGGAPLVLIFGVAGALIAVCIVVIVVRRRRSEASEQAAAAW